MILRPGEGVEERCSRTQQEDPVPFACWPVASVMSASASSPLWLYPANHETEKGDVK